jgi:hypothetical protein
MGQGSPPAPAVSASDTLGISIPAQPTITAAPYPVYAPPYPVEAPESCGCTQADLEFGFER